MIAQVIVDILNNQVNKPFDYLVPSSLKSIIEVGSRVEVPFGSRTLMGYVMLLKESSDYEASKLKYISKLIDDENVLSLEQIELGKELSQQFFGFLIQYYHLMVPTALKINYLKKIKVIDSLNCPKTILNLFSKPEMDYNGEFLKYPMEIKDLCKKGILDEYVSFSQKGNIKSKKMVYLLDETIYSSQKGLQVLHYLKEIDEPISIQILMEDMGYSKSVLDTLVRKGAIEIKEEEVYREVFCVPEDKVVTLNEEQEKCSQQIINSLNFYKTFLLQGVCGSGKTEIYLSIIEKCLKLGKTAIMLVPEIVLTPQMASRFKGRFKDAIAILHSRLSMGEKYDEWRRIKRHQAKVVLGARSALFCPLENIGVIIMDEEQEESYIQTENPRYDSHYVAIKRAKYHHCPLILGSATPLVESYYKATNDEYTLLHLYQRANGKELPQSEVVDMREELKSGNRSVFSRSLSNQIVENYRRNEQTILLINRRGYSTFVMCRSCGETIKCPHCDVSLTYHKMSNRLKCHYCGYEALVPTICPSCGSRAIRFVGDGTQKVEEELNRLLPEAQIIRMDKDTTSKKNGHQILIDQFKNHKADILIGTQMVAKGLDFPLVSLVGILNADLGLKFPSYDAYEKTYDLLEQVSGRAGRKDTNGKVIIQTYQPENKIIEAASKHNYLDFYYQELEIRKAALNPPFSNLIQIILSSKDANLVYKEIDECKKMIQSQTSNMIILGPCEALIFKLNDEYRFQLTLKALDLKECFVILNYLNERYQAMKNIKISIQRM